MIVKLGVLLSVFFATQSYAQTLPETESAPVQIVAPQGEEVQDPSVSRCIDQVIAHFFSQNAKMNVLGQVALESTEPNRLNILSLSFKVKTESKTQKIRIKIHMQYHATGDSEGYGYGYYEADYYSVSGKRYRLSTEDLSI